MKRPNTALHSRYTHSYHFLPASPRCGDTFPHWPARGRPIGRNLHLRLCPVFRSRDREFYPSESVAETSAAPRQPIDADLRLRRLRLALAQRKLDRSSQRPEPCDLAQSAFCRCPRVLRIRELALPQLRPTILHSRQKRRSTRRPPSSALPICYKLFGTAQQQQ